MNLRIVILIEMLKGLRIEDPKGVFADPNTINHFHEIVEELQGISVQLSLNLRLCWIRLKRLRDFCPLRLPSLVPLGRLAT
jgi:hypothetical protein